MTTTDSLTEVTPCQTGSNGTTETDWQMTSQLKVKVTIMVVIIVLSLLNNACVIIVIIRTRHLRRQLTYLFVLNLCIVDLVAAIVVLPFATASFALGDWPFGREFCLAEGFISLMVIVASTTSICSISIDRLYSIKSPMHYAANVTLERVILLISAIWLYAIFVAILPVFGWNDYSYQASKTYCSFTWSADSRHTAYIIVFAISGFLLPSLVIMLMNSGIYRVARKAATQIQPMPFDPSAVSIPVQNGAAHPVSDSLERQDSESTASPSSPPCITVNGKTVDNSPQPHHPPCHPSDLARSKYKAVKTLLVIILTFFIFWGPYFVFNMHCAVRGGWGCGQLADVCTSWLGFSSFAFNPVIYGMMNRSVREEMVEMVKQSVSRCRHGPDEPVPGNEDFFEFLERTSMAGTRTRPKEHKINVVCGASTMQSPDEPAMSMHSFSSMC